MNKEPRETSCYSTALIIKYAIEHGYDQKVLFEGIEDKRELLENPHEWASMNLLILFLSNFSNAGGNLYNSGIEITSNQVSNIQMLFLKVFPLKTLISSLPKHFEDKICTVISARVEVISDGSLDVVFAPKPGIAYSALLCDFNRGCTFATLKLKHLRNLELAEITCAARSDAHECRYRLTWTPDLPLISRLKEFILFRFKNQRAILAHMEESHARLSAQYDEARKLNEQLAATLAEKEKLSNELQSLNINLESKVSEQTADIRSANDSLQKTNAALRESERMKELLTGALVHDIKNHLFSMTCDVHAIDGIAGVPGEAVDVLRHTSSACSSAMSLAANMLDIGKMEEGKLVVEKTRVEFDALRAILDRYTGNALFRERRVGVQVEPPDFPFGFEADRYLLERVVQNLMTNAAMYTPAGGSVKISFAAPATVRVYNTGEPIPERYRKTLFEKYARVTIDSSKYAKGLGLFFCKLVMDAHGGSIVLECTDEGNCFVLGFAPSGVGEFK